MANIQKVKTELDNLYPYTFSSAAWSDRYSNIAVYWDDDGTPGMHCLTALLGWGGTKITDSLLKWTVKEDGNSLSLNLVDRNYRPDKVIEFDQSEELNIIAKASFPERNAIAVEFEVINLMRKKRQITISFEYPGKGVKPDWQGAFPSGHFVSLDNQPEGSWSTLFIHNEHGRNVPWVESFVSGMAQDTTIELICLAELHDRNLTIEPQSTEKFTIIMGFGTYRGRAHKTYSAALEKIRSEWSSNAETERWYGILQNAQPISPKYRGINKYERMYAHAIAGLNSLFIQGEGGLTGYKRIPWTSKSHIAIAFFWDTAFSCMGAREIDPLLCQEAIESFVENAGPRGSMPGTLSDTHRAGEGQAPVMVLAAWMTYQKSRDTEWLGRVYETLCDYSRFWFKYHASKRGLCQYYNAGQIGDNDVRFDAVYGRVQANEPLKGFESPDLNAFFVVEFRCLAKMAEVLGLGEDSELWDKKADALSQKIVDVFYFPEHSMFYDVREGTREIFSGTKGPNMFLPLWAGVPLPEEEIKRIIENHMLNPDEFYREQPFPSVSFDNPKYEPAGYWRGRIWPHIVYLMIQTLWKYGYVQEAEVTADRLINMLESSHWLNENYESAKGMAIGVPEYNWTQSIAIELLLERYKDPVVGN